eukprot:CAMPEP_0172159144 /NCGR_PEP_ID=MMETSP1050-20130122/4796_1 /TAXON_ID=233186 /ORGANISM="Cryptomonas curvata, Strain CCAP979/52" /LENGTH=144 /DNA_ID=CAMNT_0012828677 /DNA_START=196 /DNA_END=627 /DNA_ORIENTATION=+
MIVTHLRKNSLILLRDTSRSSGGVSEQVYKEFDQAVELNDLLLVEDLVMGKYIGIDKALSRLVQVEASLDMLAMVVQLGNQTMDTKAMLGTTDEFGRSLLMQAVTSKNERAAQYLLELGADVDWGGTSYSNRTPLMQAACAGSA